MRDIFPFVFPLFVPDCLIVSYRLRGIKVSIIGAPLAFLSRLMLFTALAQLSKEELVSQRSRKVNDDDRSS